MTWKTFENSIPWDVHTLFHPGRERGVNHRLIFYGIFPIVTQIFCFSFKMVAGYVLYKMAFTCSQKKKSGDVRAIFINILAVRARYHTMCKSYEGNILLSAYMLIQFVWTVIQSCWNSTLYLSWKEVSSRNGNKQISSLLNHVISNFVQFCNLLKLPKYNFYQAYSVETTLEIVIFILHTTFNYK